ncbi:NUDIX domain-containing protein [Longispora sp. K20-0274]|uniref:NUDIX domain-containing protein n=1 Tax=Longispora sp. K20-0274 TaxID=3088255 RepID=UPI00399C190D
MPDPARAGRATLAGLLAAIVPHDPTEQAALERASTWIASGADLYRTAKPATPPQHLVSYFQVIDPDTGFLLLGEHRNAGLLLPNGGHVEPDEAPWDAVVRECAEELRLRARPSAQFGTAPVFCSVTTTKGAATERHVDVSLWHVVHATAVEVSHFDEAEFAAMHWLSPHDILSTALDRLDPCMHRFVHKLQRAAGEPPTRGVAPQRPAP